MKMAGMGDGEGEGEGVGEWWKNEKMIVENGIGLGEGSKERMLDWEIIIACWES